MPSPLIILERRDAIALIRLNRPDKLNALSGKMLDRLKQVFRQLGKDRAVRAVILTGAGERAFSAGTDIAELAALDAAAARKVAARGQAVCHQIERSGVPVIAAVNGLAAGGGCELALACHLRIASISARFSLPEIKLGLIPAYGGTQRLARELGAPRALAMMLTGKTISAEEACRLGLVNSVADPVSLLPEAEALAREIARLSPLAIRACLEAVTRGLERPLPEGLKLEARLFSRLFASSDAHEGVRAFIEKRPPVFKGT